MAERKMPDGGMWNLPRTTISHDTKNLLQSKFAKVAFNDNLYYSMLPVNVYLAKLQLV